VLRYDQHNRGPVFSFDSKLSPSLTSVSVLQNAIYSSADHKSVCISNVKTLVSFCFCFYMRVTRVPTKPRRAAAPAVERMAPLPVCEAAGADADADPDALLWAWSSPPVELVHTLLFKLETVLRKVTSAHCRQ
jgi:hypothetical protein